MSSLVLDLQQDLMQQDCHIITALRKAHIIASKLKLDDFDAWIKAELDGYTGTQDNVPNYRQVVGQIKAWNPYHGWIPVLLSNRELEELLCKRKMAESISDIVELYNTSKSHFVMTFAADVANQLNSWCDAPFATKYSLHVSSHCLKSIIDQVVNCLLEWTLKLETEGIIGENMSFKQEEKEIAQTLPQQINNYYGSVINGNVGQAQIVSGSNNTFDFNYTHIAESLEKVKQAIKTSNISKDDEETAMELVSDIENKVSGKKKPGIIKAALAGLKGFLSSVGAGVAVELIVQVLSTIS